MTTGTAMALGLEENHRLHLIENGANFKVGECVIFAFEVKHDAAEPVNFIVNDGEDQILYVTDTGKISNKFDGLTKILIETNFDHETLRRSKKLDFRQTIRIRDNHLAIDSAIEFLEEIDLSECKEIYLIHVSARHGDGEEFKNLIQKVVGDNIKVIVAKNKELA